MLSSRMLFAFSVLPVAAACGVPPSSPAVESTESAVEGAPSTKVATLTPPTLTETTSEWWGATTGYPQTLWYSDLTAEVRTDAASTRIAIHFRDPKNDLNVAVDGIDTEFTAIGADGTFHVEAHAYVTNPTGMGRSEGYASHWQFDGNVTGDVITLTSFHVEEVTTSYDRPTWQDPTGNPHVKRNEWWTSTGDSTGVLE